MSKVRARFAPSPTGYLHVGGARTALFNWLFARHHGGTFILRIEDTDLERSTQESEDQVLADLRWLGIDWDEGPEVGGDYGPYRQSERLSIYKEYVQRLLDEGKAYECYCTAEELQQRREKMLAEGKAPMYDRQCLHLSDEERAELAEERSRVIRFLSPDEGEVRFRDHVRGDVVFENKLLDDLVIVKSDGYPTYNFACVVDDHLMEITHVIRGEDHLTNTARQIQLFGAFGWELPEFAHVPLILGADRTRLSKRHGAVAVGHYRDEGYLADAMVNYLALVGWAYDDKTELFSREELIRYFTLDKVAKHGATFDLKKFEWMNGVYIRQASLSELAEYAYERLVDAGLLGGGVESGAGDAGAGTGGAGARGAEVADGGAGAAGAGGAAAGTGDQAQGGTASAMSGEGGTGGAEAAGERSTDSGVPSGLDEELRARLEQIMEPLQTRMRTLAEIVPQTRFLFSDEIVFDEKAVGRFLHRDYVPELVSRLVARLIELDPWTAEGIEGIFRGLAKEYDKKLGDVIQPARVALTGTSVSPPIHDAIYLLGREKTIARLKRGAEMSKAAQAEA